MNNNQQQENVGHSEQFKKFQDLLKQTGFTGNIPFTLNYRSLSSNEKKKFLDDTTAVIGHIFNIAPNQVPAFCRLLNEIKDTNNDNNDADIDD